MPYEDLRSTLCALAQPLCAILTDERCHALLRRLTDQELPLNQTASLLLREGVPLLLQDHEQDTLRVLSALTGQSAEAVKALPLPALLALLRERWSEDLADFFACAGAFHWRTSSGSSPAQPPA